MARGRDAAVLVQQLEDGHAPARIVEYARRILVGELGIVGPALRPIGAHGDEGAVRDAAVLLLPVPHVVQRQHIVRILGRLAMDVDDHQGHQHVLRIDLIDAEQSFVEMRRRVDVGTPLTEPH